MNTETIVVLFLFLALVVGSLIAAASQDKKLQDPANTEVVYTHQLEGVALMKGAGTFLVRTIRQSGNLQQEDKIFSTAEDAIRSAVATFRRAKIDHVVIETNTISQLSFRRPYHDHRGRQEGKKVGAVTIVRA